MEIKIKLLHPDAVIPRYATQGSSGFDLVAIEDVQIAVGETKLIRTGLSVEFPTGFEMQIRPRSGNSLKTGLRIPNSPSTIDSDFRGELLVLIELIPKNNMVSYQVRKGDRIAQGVICPVVRVQLKEVEQLSDTVRGSGGFGHTGV
jgi:dUTP pyrophosphatase